MKQSEKKLDDEQTDQTAGRKNCFAERSEQNLSKPLILRNRLQPKYYFCNASRNHTSSRKAALHASHST